MLEGDERHYFKKMKDILEDFPNKGPPECTVPTSSTPLYWQLRNAEDLNMLQRLNISHVLNVAGTRQFDLTKSPYPKEIGIKEYLMIPAEDHDSYNIVQHFLEANAFINRAKRVGGKALVHCNLGVNRCGALCAAYLLIEERLPLLEVITFLKRKRAVVLCNKGFRRQLLRYAMARGLIEIVDNGNKYGTLGTISKYLVNKPAVRTEVERKIERIKESEIARRREKESNSENNTEKDKTSNNQPLTNGVANGSRNGEKSNEVDNGREVKENVDSHPVAMNGDVSEEDEEVASLVNQPPKVSRFLARNSTIYSPDPSQNEPRSYSPTRLYGKPYTGDTGSSSTRPYSPVSEFGTFFGNPTGMKPHQRSFSADIESHRNGRMSPEYDNIFDEKEPAIKFKSRRGKKYGDGRQYSMWRQC